MGSEAWLVHADPGNREARQQGIWNWGKAEERVYFTVVYLILLVYNLF